MQPSNLPTIPDDKISYYREQLYRELAHMFKWEGLPKTIPHDYLERNLVRYGRVMFFEDEEIGLDILRAEPLGMNRHEQPTEVRSSVHSTNEILKPVYRKVKRITDSENVDFDPLKDAVLIQNMAYGESCKSIVDHFAERLALAQLAFDTNLMWQNMPYLFVVNDKDIELSIKKLIADIFTGKPKVILDKKLMQFNQNGEASLGTTIDVDLKAKDLLDVRNELMMKFRETVGIDTAGVDKAERVGSFEVEANEQHTKTVLQIMLEQRQIACENINHFFDLDVRVGIIEPPKQELGGEEDSTGNDRVEEPSQDEF